MVRTASLFSQLLDLFPRNQFQRSVKAHRAERYTKGFTCWEQFVAMLFRQLAQAHSLREICDGLSCCLGKLIHVGVREAPKRSTLSYANAWTIQIWTAVIPTGFHVQTGMSAPPSGCLWQPMYYSDGWPADTARSLNRLWYLTYPAAFSSSAGMNRSEAELMQ